MYRYVISLRHPKGSGFPSGRYLRAWKTKMMRTLGADHCEYSGNPTGTFRFIIPSARTLTEFRLDYPDAWEYDLEGERVSRRKEKLNE